MNEKQEMLKLLRNRPTWLTYKKIESDTGIATGWLTRAAQGLIKQPNPDKITVMLNYLKTITNATTTTD